MKLQRPRITALLATLATILVLTPSTAFARSVITKPNSDLQTINNPAGGQVVYGPITSTTSLRDAMSSMLHNVHDHFGDKPQIGKFFQNKNNGSIAVIFHLTAKNQGNKPIAGMVIVSLAYGAKDGVAAVLYDDAQRFAKTQPALMQKLNDSWHQQNATLVSEARKSGGNSSAPSEPATRGNGPGGIFGTNEPATASVPLHLAKNGDNSGSIGLPDGWHVIGGGGGSLVAQGDNGELIRMADLVGNIYDPNTQQGASMLRYMSRGTVQAFACPYSMDLAADYLCVMNQFRQRNHQQPISMHVLSTRLSPQNPSAGAMLVDMDPVDGKGPFRVSMEVIAHRMGPGNWNLTIDEVRLPKPASNEAWSTAAGMIMSFRQNEAVIRNETIAVINQINEKAKAARLLADAKGQANDVHNAQVDAQWDQQAKQNKAFENYTLDYSVLHDPETGGSYGRADYPTADFLVKALPERFEYAQTQDLLKGIDY